MRPVGLLPDVLFIFAFHAVIVGGFHRNVKLITAICASLIKQLGSDPNYSQLFSPLVGISVALPGVDEHQLVDALKVFGIAGHKL